jgi:single-strand DNA-binding protein
MGPLRCQGKLAEIAERFVTKGKQVFVEGRLQPRRFEDCEGSPKTVTEGVVVSLRVLGGAPNASRKVDGQGVATTGTTNRDSETVPL